MSPEDRKHYIKNLIKMKNKTARDYEKIGKAYERHIHLLKEEAKLKTAEIVDTLDTFTTSLI
jgi:hypothetical protein